MSGSWPSLLQLNIGNNSLSGKGVLAMHSAISKQPELKSRHII